MNVFLQLAAVATEFTPPELLALSASEKRFRRKNNEKGESNGVLHSKQYRLIYSELTVYLLESRGEALVISIAAKDLAAFCEPILVRFSCEFSVE